jgi:hypothetical protein
MMHVIRSFPAVLDAINVQVSCFGEDGLLFAGCLKIRPMERMKDNGFISTGTFDPKVSHNMKGNFFSMMRGSPRNGRFSKRKGSI